MAPYPELAGCFNRSRDEKLHWASGILSFGSAVGKSASSWKLALPAGTEVGAHRNPWAELYAEPDPKDGRACSGGHARNRT